MECAKQAEVCAIVVTFNRKVKLKKCIECLQGQIDVTCDIIIVDNASKDGTEDMILSDYNTDSIHYFNTGENLGSAGGFNFGAKKGMAFNYKYLWFMDDDVYPDCDALIKLLDADKGLLGNWGCLSSFAYWKDGSICKANRQKKNLFSFVADNAYEKPLIPARIVSFASMLVKADIMREVGYPIADYYFYTDDYEFSARISDKYPVYVIPESKVLHDMDRNIKANIVKDPPEKMYRYKTLFRNDMHFYRRYGGTGWIYLGLKYAYTLLNICMNEREKKKEKIKILNNGVREGINFFPEIEYPT